MNLRKCFKKINIYEQIPYFIVWYLSVNYVINNTFLLTIVDKNDKIKEKIKDETKYENCKRLDSKI